MQKKRINHHQCFSRNEQGTDYFIGDVHGHYDLLLNELHKSGFNADSGDRVFSVGDLINRGSQSDACLELLLKPWFFAVIGNHEDMFLTLRTNPSIINSLIRVGGEWLLELEKTPEKLTFLMAIVYAKMHLAITITTPYGNIGLTHAQAPDDWLDITQNNLPEDQQDLLFWSSEKFNRPKSLERPIKNIDITVHGHTNSENIVVKQNQVWIDTLRCSKKITVITAKQLFELKGATNACRC